MALTMFICALSVALPSVLHLYIHRLKTKKRENKKMNWPLYFTYCMTRDCSRNEEEKDCHMMH